MRRRHFFLLLCVLLMTISGLPSFLADFLEYSTLSLYPGDSEGFARIPGRSLLSLSPKNVRNTALIASLDGNIHLVESNSVRVIWSFSSGPPIYTSYNAPIIHDRDKENASGLSSQFFIDCGDDWELYMHSEHFGRMKLSMTIEEFVRRTPYIFEDGAVTVGSREARVFEIDPMTGKLIHSYLLSDSPTMLVSYDIKNKDMLKSGLMKPLEPRLYITRTDYSLKSFLPGSEEVSWNMTMAEIGATLLCPNAENPASRVPLNLRDTVDLDIDFEFSMPLLCQSKGPVYRQRTLFLLESYRAENSTLSKPDTTFMHPRANIRGDSSRKAVKEHQPLNKDQERGKGIELTALYVVLSMIMLFISYCKYVPWIKQILNEQGELKRWMPYKNLGYCTVNGRRLGKLLVSSTEIAKGSNGTIVLEGIYEGRPAAVKRLVKAHHDVAFKEIQNLIASDQHPNIVRWYGVEYDQDFVYLSLERCACNLDDLIQIYSNSTLNHVFSENKGTRTTTEYKLRLGIIKNLMQDLTLWKPNGHPSPLLLKMMRDIVSGIRHLHELGIIHRDLKPQNVLLIKERSLCAKLSDMGISKRLVGDMSSLGHHATGCGSSGWQAPEQLLHGRQTRAVDLFSLGCVLFFCISGGRHPFGNHLERDMNIVKNQMDLFLVEYIPEAKDLISHLLNPRPELRPKAFEVLQHPLFWSSETRLSFLREISDRVELEDREAGSNLLRMLERIAPVALGARWDEKMEPVFISNIVQYRRYKYDSVRDLLRVIRNKLNHYRELPKKIQVLSGTDNIHKLLQSTFVNIGNSPYLAQPGIPRHLKKKKVASEIIVIWVRSWLFHLLK